jgi:hypothetical protein
MFTTGVHAWLYWATGCYFVAFILYCFHRQRTGQVALFAGFIGQSLYLLGRGWLGDIFIPNAIFEGPFFLPWCLGVIPVVLSVRKPHKNLGGELALAVAFSIFPIFYAKGIIPPTPNKTSVWALLFFMSESTAHALFYTGALYAFFSLVGKNTTNGFSSWIVWGFVAYTVAQVTGAVWSFLGWGNTFSWGSRHLSSAAIWTFYAACLHLQFIHSWKRKSAFVAIAGAALVFFISFSNYIHEMSFLRVGG